LLQNKLLFSLATTLASATRLGATSITGLKGRNTGFQWIGATCRWI
jgi:hypothetical protein